MTEESSFEIISKKSDELENDTSQKKSPKSASLVTNTPSDLPNFVTVSSFQPQSTSGIFHSTGFRPEIPENKTKTDSPVSDKGQNYDENDEGLLGGSLFGWVRDTVGGVGGKGSSLLSKVAEKAKSSVGSVITTLDPQMRDFISSTCDFELIVASDKEIEVSPIREAFQNIFNNINVRGLETDSLEIAKQIVGFEAASKAAFLRMEAIRNQHPANSPIIAVQSFITEVSKNKWYDLDLLILHDLEKDLQLETYSQMIPIPTSIIDVVREDSEENYKYQSTGFSVTVSNTMGNNLQVHPSEWHETLTGVSRRTRILFAAKVLANLYKNTLL